MRSLPDFDHADDGPAFREAVADLFDGVSVAFVEGVNGSWSQKHHRDEVLTALANDRAALVDADRARERGVANAPRSGHVVVTEDGQTVSYPADETLDGWLAVVEAIAESDSLDRVDTGPAHEGTWPDLLRRTFEIQRTPPAERAPGETELLASTVRLRDENWARYLDDLDDAGAVDLDDAGLVVGRFHAPQRLVAADHDVTPVDSPRGAAPTEVGTRAATRHVLRSSDAGYALLGPPGEVAERLGAAGAQARLAALGAALCTETRLWGGEPADALRAYDEGVATALANEPSTGALPGADRPPASALTADGETVAAAFDDGPAREVERVRRLQEAAREPLERLVDLDAAADYGDLDPTPPDRPRSTAAVVADVVPEDGVGAETVRPLLDDRTCALGRGRLRPRRLASLRAVGYGGHHQRLGGEFVVEPLDHDADAAAAALSREVADLAAVVPDLDVGPTAVTAAPPLEAESVFGRLRSTVSRAREGVTDALSPADGGRDPDAIAPGGPAAVDDLAAHLAAPGADLDGPLGELTAGDVVSARVAGAFRGVARAQTELLPDERSLDRAGASTPDDPDRRPDDGQSRG